MIACEPGREAELAAGKVVPIDTVGIGWGRHPQESPETPWIFFASQIPTASDGMDPAESRANAHGWPICLGPEIETLTSDEPRLQPSCRDEIAEWTAYHTAGRRFTLDTPWPDTPVGFRRTFGAQWARLCGEGRVAETDFFRDWNLATLAARASKAVKAANRLVGDLVGDLDRVRRGESETVCPPVPTRGGNSFRSVPQVGFSLTEAEEHRLFLFDDLARHRVFALPHLLTREDVGPVLAHLKRQLLAGLPEARDLLGTPRCWEVFLGVEARRLPGATGRGQAISDYLRSNISATRFAAASFTDADRARWLRNGQLIPPPATAPPSDHEAFEHAKRNFNHAYKAEQNSSRHIPRWVAYVDTLIQATFPRMDMQALIQPTPS
ncbi:MAG: hypothetical protein KF791_06545 [Verrucomicrobiae bacterium]|nr:hypothetical protein [Verrucomicrobiae bacterium]